jgi:ABC-type multidrug transport system fused ATPase/permease subunit
MHYDRIFVLDAGRLVQSGSPQELLDSPGVFREMVGDKLGELQDVLNSGTI